MLKQKYKSNKTSVNSITKVYNKFDFGLNSLILDYGGGRFDTNKNFMESKGHKLFVYDPYNRSNEHNEEVISLVLSYGGADIIVCANVLNVIYEDEVVYYILNDMKKYMHNETIIYIQIYEGDKTGVGRETIKGYQRNLMAGLYYDFINEVYKDFEITKLGNIFKIVRK